MSFRFVWGIIGKIKNRRERRERRGRKDKRVLWLGAVNLWCNWGCY